MISPKRLIEVWRENLMFIIVVGWISVFFGVMLAIDYYYDSKEVWSYAYYTVERLVDPGPGSEQWEYDLAEQLKPIVQEALEDGKLSRREYSEIDDIRDQHIDARYQQVIGRDVERVVSDIKTKVD